MLLQVEVAVQGHKDDSTEERSMDGILGSSSTSFERVSQEIERASQELPSVRGCLSSKSGSQQCLLHVPRGVSQHTLDSQRVRGVSTEGEQQVVCSSGKRAAGQENEPVCILHADGKEEAKQAAAQPSGDQADAATGRLPASACQQADVTAAGVSQKIPAGQQQELDLSSHAAGPSAGADSQIVQAHAAAQHHGTGKQGAMVDPWGDEDDDDAWEADVALLLQSAAALRPAGLPNLASQSVPGPSGTTVPEICVPVASLSCPSLPPRRPGTAAALQRVAAEPKQGVCDAFVELHQATVAAGTSAKVQADSAKLLLQRTCRFADKVGRTC